MMTFVRRSPVLVVGIIVGLSIGLAEFVAGAPMWRALLSTAIPIAYGSVVTLIGRRSEMVSVLAGRPVDERWEHINLEATAWSLGVSAVVVLGAFIAADTSGGDWLPYAFVASVMAVSYVGAVAILRLRH
jgi:hypothetical protein